MLPHADAADDDAAACYAAAAFDMLLLIFTSYGTRAIYAADIFGA